MSALTLALAGLRLAVAGGAGAGLINSADARTANAQTANAQTIAEKPLPIMSVAPLQAVMLASDVIGSRKAGWLCVPAGSTHWRDAAPDPQATAAAVDQALSGSSATQGDRVPWAGSPVDAELSIFILSGKVLSASVQACSPQWGMGKLLSDKRTIKGRGDLTVSWTIYRRHSRSVVDVCETSRKFTFSGSAGLPAILQAEVTRTAQTCAERLAAAVRDRE